MASTALAAIAASNAEPPARSTSRPAAEASECDDVTMPFGASVTGRPVRMSNSSPRFCSAADPPDHVIVVGGFADLMPLVLFVAERDRRIVQRLEFCVLCRNFGKQLVGGLERRVKNVGRERPELRAGRNQPLDGGRVAGIIFGGQVGRDLGGGNRHHVLIEFWQ